ncbi:MAG: xanthine dehydrogenase family protein subunit M [Proteobacteria bacterium]|nr:xanthine dehydrogenase family protein subunit M [Pseudomonadota bacterium]
MTAQLSELKPPATITVARPKSLEALRAHVQMTPAPHYFLAGGTDLLVMHKDGVIPSSSWVDITAIAELGGIEVRDGRVRLGARVTHEEIARSPFCRLYAPALVDGCAVIGGPQIRWRGTIGGNLANASPAADTVPALYTLEAEVEIMGRDGEMRCVGVADLASGPRRSTLADGELITAVWFAAQEGVRGGFLRLGQRQSQAISKVSVAVTAVPRGEGPDGQGGFKTGFSTLRIACGAVAPTVIRAPRAEAALLEGGLTAASVARAVALIREEVRPIDDLRSTQAYRREMAGVLLERVLSRMI